MHALVLIAILAVPAERSRGRHNPRVVKRKMSRFSTKARATPPAGQVFRYEDQIRVVTPLGSPVRQVPPPAPTPEEKPKRRRPRKASAPIGRHPAWLQHVRSWRVSGLSRAAFCERHGLSPCTFHQGVAHARQIFRKAGPQS